MEIIKGYIVSLSDYNDKEFIINILSEDNLYSASLFKSKRKKNSSYQLFSYGEFTLYKGPTKYFKVKDFIPLFLIKNSYDDLDRLLSLDFYNELLTNILLNENDIDYKKMFTLLKFFTTYIEDFSINNNYLLLFFYYNLLKIIGLNLKESKYFINKENFFEVFDKDIKIENEEFKEIFKYFSKILNDYMSISLNSYQNFI